MLDSATAELLRAILDEVCANISRYETGVRAHVAARLLEAATRGEKTPSRLKQIGVEALREAPTMWR
ncbi:hypothetical protein [Bradyrhizobium sp. BR 1432]|uniref:hypothetical protein n=1 Tax=Bradyrhizobium sp. BR 1432 TaxID=3447966 RepID=UPI003EE809A3